MAVPYYSDEYVTLYHGDCREIAPSLVADALVTDPPYGLGDRWQGGTWGAAEMYQDARQWDAEPFDLATLLGFVEQCGPSIVWGGNYYALPPSRCWLSWVKSSQMPTMADYELAWTNLDRPSKLFREDRNPDGRRWHPTQKPVSVMLWSLTFVPFATTILDPFAGAGTTLRAAKDLGRRAIGIEVHEPYCEAAAQRLSQSVLDFGGAA